MSSVIDGVDYGPLAQLVGTWWGDRGLDIAPEPDGQDAEAYYDQITFTPSGPADNAEEQDLVTLRYHQVVRKRANGRIFHDQVGHWIYEPSSGMIYHSLSIPRGVSLLAGGELRTEGGATVFEVKAEMGSETFGVAQAPFMLEKARTEAFHMVMTVEGNELSYEETTFLDIYGRKFEHKDRAKLERIMYDI